MNRHKKRRELIEHVLDNIKEAMNPEIERIMRAHKSVNITSLKRARQYRKRQMKEQYKKESRCRRTET